MQGRGSDTVWASRQWLELLLQTLCRVHMKKQLCLTFKFLIYIFKYIFFILHMFYFHKKFKIKYNFSGRLFFLFGVHTARYVSDNRDMVTSTSSLSFCTSYFISYLWAELEEMLLCRATFAFGGLVLSLFFLFFFDSFCFSSSKELWLCERSEMKNVYTSCT